MRVVVVVDGFGQAVPGTDAVAAIVAGWRAVAPEDELIVCPPDPAVLGAALEGAGLAVVGVAAFDWSALRDSVVTAVAGAALERGVPCVVLAGAVSVGRREAASIGVDAAHAVDPPSHENLAAQAGRVARRWSRRSPIGGA